MTRFLRGILALVTLTCVSASSFAQSDEVVDLFERGLEAYRLANYEEAEQLFAQAHALEPMPDLSYNHARALELLGRFGDAADVYARYLEEAPATDDREVIESRIQNLRARHAREQVQSDPDLEDTSAVHNERPSLVGPLVIIGGGLALAAAGVATGLAGTSAHETALDVMTSQTDADAANGRAARLARTTNVLLAVGGGVLAAGVTWLVIKLVRGGEGDGDVSLHLAPTGVGVRGAF